MNSFSKYESVEDLSINGEKEIAKFLRGNYLKFTMLQFCEMLNITPGVIKDILTPSQMMRMGSRSAATVVFVRDSSHFEEDSKRFYDEAPSS